MINIRIFLSENFHFLLIKFSVHLNRHVFLMVVEKENKAVNSQRVNWNKGDQEAHTKSGRVAQWA